MFHPGNAGEESNMFPVPGVPRAVRRRGRGVGQISTWRLSRIIQLPPRQSAIPGSICCALKVTRVTVSPDISVAGISNLKGPSGAARVLRRGGPSPVRLRLMEADVKDH